MTRGKRKAMEKMEGEDPKGLFSQKMRGVMVLIVRCCSFSTTQ